MSPTRITDFDAVDLAHAIASRQVSCAEVMAAHLDRIAALNPKVNAIVSLVDRDALMAQARACDARGDAAGPLRGFPLAVKDLELTAGIRTAMGSRILANNVPTADSILVERIKAAGGIVIGKTNTPEFGMGSQTYNAVFGTTLNAYDQTKTAGGSSGGAAVALALRMLPLADGSDYGGSLRNPAAFNNVFGFRTSFGRVPVEGPDIFLPSMGVLGPMARSIPDLALFLSVLAGFDARAPLSLRDDPARFRDVLKRDFRGVRVAWLGDLGGRLPFEPGLLDLCRSALEAFAAIGCVVEDAAPEFDYEALWQAWIKLRSWQGGFKLRDFYADPKKRALMKPEAIWEIERGLRLSAFDISEAATVRAHWYQTVRRFFERYDYALLPSAQVFPFDAAVHWPQAVGGRTMDTYHRWMEVVAPITLSGCPALNVPAGFGPQGLPMGLQIVAPVGEEMKCLALAQAYDEATGWVRNHPPPLAAGPG